MGLRKKSHAWFPTPILSLPFPSFYYALLCCAVLCCAVLQPIPPPTGVCFAPLDSNELLINLSSSHPSIPASLRLMFLDFSLFVHFTIIPLRNCFSPELTIYHWMPDSNQHSPFL
jgi:hypothetical protein